MNTQTQPVPFSAPAPGTRMRSVVQDGYGPHPEDVLRMAERDVPAIGPEEVLVRVRGASVDRGTWHLMAGEPYLIRAGFGLRRPKRANPGLNLAGVVAAVGSSVADLGVGDEVFGTGISTFADFAVARHDRLALKPARLTFHEAATLPVSGLTALQAVRDRARVGEGDRVLVLGASGGVGSFAVQIAKAAGAHVTAVCSGAKADRMREIGADRVLDYARDDIAAERYDVLLEMGGLRPLRVLRSALAARGRLVIVGGEGGGRWTGGIGRQLRAQLLSPFVRQQLGTFISSENAADLRALAELVDRGAVVPVVSHVFALEETAAAVRVLLDGEVVGKAAIRIDA
jgi:NADPH:quinone reductase-like Zn-dependent oxidoreductase